jgi:hypothetical protein
MTPSEILKSLLQDGVDGSVSSKRLITIIAFIFCCIAFVANLFFGKKMDEFIYNTMAYIVLGGMGTVVAEKFAPSNKENS